MNNVTRLINFWFLALIVLSGACIASAQRKNQDMGYSEALSNKKDVIVIAKANIKAEALIQYDANQGDAAKILRMSLPESIKVALSNNRRLAISKEEKMKAEGRLTEAQAGQYPYLNLSGSYTRLDKVSEFDIGLQKIKSGELNNYKAELGLTQPLYTGGRVSNSIELASLGIKYSEEDFRSSQELVTFLVTKAYYDVLLAQDMVETNRKSLELIQAHLDEVAKSHKQGVVSNYDLLRAKVQVANINTLYLESVNKLHLARISFINTIGLSLQGEPEIELTDKFVYEPTAQLGENMMVIVAFENRADLKQARLRTSMQATNIDLAQAGNRPTFSLFGNWGEENPSARSIGVTGWNDYWNAGAVLAWPIFEGGRIKGKVIQEEAVLRQVQLMQRDIEEQIRFDVKQALLNLKDAEELVKSQQENVNQAEEGLRLARIGYEQGVHTQLEVLDTQSALDSARKNMSAALYAHMIARVMLDKAMGILGQK